MAFILVLLILGSTLQSQSWHQINKYIHSTATEALSQSQSL